MQGFSSPPICVKTLLANTNESHEPIGKTEENQLLFSLLKENLFLFLILTWALERSAHGGCPPVIGRLSFSLKFHLSLKICTFLALFVGEEMSGL